MTIASYIGVQVQRKIQKAFFADLQEIGDRAPHDVLLYIALPCGRVVQYKTIANVPTVDTPCPCGDPNHWVMKYVDLIDAQEEHHGHHRQ